MVTFHQYERALATYNVLVDKKLARTPDGTQKQVFMSAKAIINQYQRENIDPIYTECQKRNRAEIDALSAEVDDLPDKEIQNV